MNYISLLILVSITLLFSACSKNIPSPQYGMDFIKFEEQVEGYYKNKIGIKKDLALKKEIYTQNHQIRLWPLNNYRSVCFERPLCLIDTKNNHQFTHSAVKGREELFPLHKPVKYKIITRVSRMIDYPEIFHNKEIQQGIQVIHIPKLNFISTKEIGESIYQKINTFNFDTYKIKINNHVSGTYTDVIGENKTSFELKLDKLFILKKWPEKGYKTICTEDNICLLDKEDKGFFTHSAIETESKLSLLDTPVKYSAIQDILYNEDSFKYEVLYQGKIANNIKISFREFYKNMARPAFTQDIEYELNNHKPTIIGFKGLRIKIIKATNLNITYEVIKDFNKN